MTSQKKKLGKYDFTEEKTWEKMTSQKERKKCGEK